MDVEYERSDLRPTSVAGWTFPMGAHVDVRRAHGAWLVRAMAHPSVRPSCGRRRLVDDRAEAFALADEWFAWARRYVRGPIEVRRG